MKTPRVTGFRNDVTIAPSCMGDYPWTTFRVTFEKIVWPNRGWFWELTLSSGPGGIIGHHVQATRYGRSKKKLVTAANVWLAYEAKKLRAVKRWVNVTC